MQGLEKKGIYWNRWLKSDMFYNSGFRLPIREASRDKEKKTRIWFYSWVSGDLPILRNLLLDQFLSGAAFGCLGYSIVYWPNLVFFVKHFSSRACESSWTYAQVFRTYHSNFIQYANSVLTVVRRNMKWHEDLKI